MSDPLTRAIRTGKSGPLGSDLGPDLGLYICGVVRIRHGRGLLLLTAASTVVVLLTLPAPASALTVTLPTVPAPVSGGAGGATIDVTVKGPASTGIEVQLLGVPSTPALPIGPAAPVTEPIATPPVRMPTLSSPQPASSPHLGGRDSSVAAPGNYAAAVSASPFAAGPARPVASPEPTRQARVSAAINARPADSLLHRVQTIASRLALWALLAAVVFVLEMLVGSAVRVRRPKPAGLS